MGRILPLGSIPDSLVFPDSVLRLKTVGLEEKHSKESDDGEKKAKLMIVLKAKVVEPKEFANLPYTHYFVIGNEDDPDADELTTWALTPGSRDFKKYTNKNGVPKSDEEDSDTYYKACEGSEFLVTMIQETEQKEGKYKGQPRNNIRGWWAIGEKDAGVLSGAAPAGKPAAVKAKATGTAPAAQAKAAPSDEVTCTQCKKRVKKTALRAHVDEHMAEMMKATGGDTAGAEE